MQNAHQTYLNTKFFKSLDGIRFFSIMAVIWHHAMPSELPAWATKGFLGVDMFFVLSGYLIVTLLLREKESRGYISLRDFYLRRSLRIFPVYFGVLIALGLLYLVVKSDPEKSQLFISLLPIYLFFIANWSVVHIPNLEIYWSLAAEEQFYIIWPFLEKILRRKTVIIVLVIAIIINQLINFGLLDHLFIALYGSEKATGLAIIDSTFTPICLGVLLAHCLHKSAIFIYFHRLFQNSLSPWLTLLLLLGVIVFSPGDISGIWRLLIQLVMFLWLASLVIQEDHSMKCFMQLYPVKRIGQISYGMYVYHMFALHIARVLLEKLNLNGEYFLFLLGSVITIIVADLSFRFYETPFLRLRKHFSAS